MSTRQLESHICVHADWDSNHCGLEARHCVAIAVVNRAHYPVHFTSLELRRGSGHQMMQVCT